tara:strand:- start:2084 stop:2596 length:513 start_codon:yes stop_codon:yes gene_type:complete
MDFAQLVAKMNEIEKNESPELVKETGEMKTEVGATKDLLTKFTEIQDANPYEPVVEAKAEEVEETMQDRFAKFMKAERSLGTDVDAIKNTIDEGTAEYEYADKAFSKMGELIEVMQKMVSEGGMLGRKINEAGGDASALVEMQQALNVATEALKRAHNDALGIAVEQTEE